MFEAGARRDGCAITWGRALTRLSVELAGLTGWLDATVSHNSEALRGKAFRDAGASLM